MNVSVRLFAAARDSIGTSELGVELGDGMKIADLRSKLQNDYPELETLFRLAMFAVNEEYANDTTTLANEDVVACIPPVSGG